MGAINKRKQSGLALITVLMILAIMVTVASTMTGRLVSTLKRTEGIIFSQKTYWYSQAAAELGRMVLNEDFSDSDVSSLDQMWATPDLVFPLENGHIAGKIKDLRSCLNVNAINSDDTVEEFTTLLEELGLSDNSAETIAESTRDWIDDNDTSDASLGAEDSFYEALAVPHLTGNNLMVDISELRAVQGVDKEAYKIAAPYLCAIPSSVQSINVNTVDIEQPEILYALFASSTDLSVSDFKGLLEERPTSGWDSVDDFLDESLFSSVDIDDSVSAQLSVSSEFFQFEGTAAFEDRLLVFQFLFEVEDNNTNVIRYQSGGFR